MAEPFSTSASFCATGVLLEKKATQVCLTALDALAASNVPLEDVGAEVLELGLVLLLQAASVAAAISIAAAGAARFVNPFMRCLSRVRRI
jgi:hypothetical protein